MIVRWLFFGSVAAVLEKDMLGYVNKFRMRHKMEELHELPSLHDAAKMQATHMCTRGILTHEGPNGDGNTLADRLKRFRFVGLNVGENIAKQEDDDYTEVAKLWMGSEEHRNNILGDYVYSGIATCVGKDGNRYWVHVFGKDVSNVEIARMRIRSEATDTDRPDEEDQSKHIGNDEGIGSIRYTQAGDSKQSESIQIGDQGYVMVIKPVNSEEYRFDTERILMQDMDREQVRMKDKVEDGRLNRKAYNNENNKNGMLIGRNVLQYSRLMSEAAANKKTARDIKRLAEHKQLSFGDYLIPEISDEKQLKTKSIPKGNENRIHEDDTNDPDTSNVHKLNNRNDRYVDNSPSTGEDRSRPKTIRLHTSTGSVVTLLFKNPESSTMAPAIQSLVQLIKKADENNNLSDIKQGSQHRPVSAHNQYYQDTRDEKEPMPMHGRKSSPDEEPSIHKGLWSADSPIERTLTVTATRSEPASTTTVYLPQYLNEAEIAHPSKRASPPEQRTYERDINDEGWRDADKRQIGANEINTNGDKNNNIIRPTMILTTDNMANKQTEMPKDTQTDKEPTNPRIKRKDNGHKCIDGYNKDGSCIMPKEVDYNQDKLNNMLDDLVNKGRIHLHIVPDETCTHGNCEKQDENAHGGLGKVIRSKIDIGLPFSDRL
ncbi:SCP/PR1 domain-containing protein [Ordospora colligata]|uniref:SCP/PR1 domain-containing protein n=1 Tax=Ordospora colligata OC4 TaxID=1354746 RepID=A0A0B2ULA9_9MICR|nr:SCP/PR1 domain-containing protein [Ordospora colligata OC4]KHN70089.1 SCP/PR1 domain-containing protein [Ordospora colligata OC4]TBU16471.1 SCP/PR1 domain-containing protein [Ordospora colligata]TBU16656.1 SCP/PR1 domain-containing protein [Ordospora colligata]TBU19229.1 SCP/PR1 domain-containing protein [Ordospora colligata]